MPKIHQLFRWVPRDEFLQAFLACYKLVSLEDKSVFSKPDLRRYGTLVLLAPLLRELYQYYVPCKASTYILPPSQMTEAKAVTVLRQVVRLHGYRLFIREAYGPIDKNCSKSKRITYQLWPVGEDPTHYCWLPTSTTLRFD